MFECETCTEQFYDHEECCIHMNQFGHWPECETCTRTFDTQRACNQHMSATNHWKPTFPCETCNQQFYSEQAANQHMAAAGHWKHYCSECARRFESENNLRMHLNSRVHRGATVSCPFCKVGHTTASGLSHHLESGSCPKAPQLNRETIHRIIRERDPHGVITNKQITWHGGTTATYEATDQAWNGRCWECYMCHRGFKSDVALNQHLNSPAHQQKVYHCPNGRCGKEFVALAGLFNHLESEQCSFMRFENVQAHVGNVLSGNRLIAF